MLVLCLSHPHLIHVHVISYYSVFFLLFLRICQKVLNLTMICFSNYTKTCKNVRSSLWIMIEIQVFFYSVSFICTNFRGMVYIFQTIFLSVFVCAKIWKELWVCILQMKLELIITKIKNLSMTKLSSKKHSYTQ